MASCHVFYEEYLEYETITTPRFKDFKENNPGYCQNVLMLIGVIFDHTFRRVLVFSLNSDNAHMVFFASM